MLVQVLGGYGKVKDGGFLASMHHGNNKVLF